MGALHDPRSRKWRRFNGAATARSRMVGDASYRGNVEALASMGPRPLGRGWLLPCRRQGDHRVASMGPRPLGRGWLLYKAALG